MITVFLRFHFQHMDPNHLYYLDIGYCYADVRRQRPIPPLLPYLLSRVSDLYARMPLGCLDLVNTMDKLVLAVVYYALLLKLTISRMWA